MKRKGIIFIFAFLIVLGMAKPAYGQEILSENIYTYEEEYIPVLIQWKEKGQVDDSIEDPVKRRIAYIDDLQNVAQASQKKAIEIIEHQRDSRIYYESFYIINGMTLKAPISVIEEIAQLPNILSVDLNLPEKLEIQGNNLVDPNDDYWNLEMTGVLKAWEKFGTKGEGVTIGFIDSGVDFKDPSLRRSFRGMKSDGRIETKGNWYDLINNEPLPVDDFKHGTATLGVAVADGEDRPIGVAPGAKWIAVRAFSSDFAINEYILKAGQWMLAPDGDPSKAPDIINNSWGGNASIKPWFISMLDSWEKAGIFSVFAAGNASELAKPGSIDNPASLENAFSVGAVDRQGKLGHYSKRGPSSFNEKIIKPEIVAPGTRIMTLAKDGGYEYWTGTSIAAPHVTGAVALMKSIEPRLSNEEIRQILIATAKGTTDEEYPTSPNMGYGYGLIQVDKACEMAKNMTQRKDVLRIAGKDRYETSRKISQQFFDRSKYLYIASGSKFTDGLTMGALTKNKPGPLLLLGKDLDEDTRAEIQRLQPEEIIIIGGQGSVSRDIEEKLRGICENIRRIHGSNRFATAKAIADELNGEKEIFLVNGYIDADAINIAGVASKYGRPVLLTDVDQIPKQTMEYIEDHNIKTVRIIGGTNQINGEVEKILGDRNITTTRIAGKNRYETAAMVNGKYMGDAKEVFIANGIHTADALAISPVLSQKNGAIQISDANILPKAGEIYLKNAPLEEIIILGGRSSIDPKVETILMKFINGEE
ncbi:MAG: S8 family serine peptidase [Tissierellia bacterium]|nr:S8 family serine peptidase [Tissierellia bacterium]